MKATVLILISIYGGMLTFILLYSLTQGNLVISYLKSRRKGQSPAPVLKEFPFVTVQLPVYNEKYVVERLIDAVAGFDYPKDSFEIQVLDDSTDETIEIIARKVRQIQQEGVAIKHVRREGREGFKAGALAFGLKQARGTLIAIFDADFLPEPDFLIKTVPYFRHEEIGVVQTRWEHINRDYSFLTSLQAFGLDAHFTVEQGGRNAAGYFINFNGTAGVWRKECIEDAGGWQSDTLTEDLDLSYRAQLKGWKFKYLEGVGAPAELPAAMNALKTQQFRWTKGAAECTRKNLPMVLRNKKLPLATKLHAIFHLMNSFLFVCIIATALLSIPLLSVKHYFNFYPALFSWAGIFLLSLLILSAFYWVSMLRSEQGALRRTGQFLILFPLFLSISMGLSLHNAIAVMEGYAGRKTPFIRTPKFSLVNKKDGWKGNKYLSTGIPPLAFFEGALALYFTAGLFLAWRYHDYGLLPFHLMLAFGFGAVSFLSFTHSLRPASR